MRADKMLAAGDIDGKRVWVRIMKAVEELQRTDRGIVCIGSSLRALGGLG